MKPMITNGGPHSADTWADLTTDTILGLIQVDDTPTGDAAALERRAEARQAKRDLRPVLFDIFMGHHDGVQRQERSALASIKKIEHAHEHVAKTLEFHEHVPSALEEVNATLAATPFAEHFAKPEVRAILQTIIGQHTADVLHIERRWHVDRLAAAKGA